MSNPIQATTAKLPAWTNEMFRRQASAKSKTPWEAAWGNNGDFNEQKTTENGALVPAINFDYFDPDDGDLGNREIRYNKNLLNPDQFAKYWQTGKHKGYKIYKGLDKDGDNQPDLIAVNPEGQVVGFNERYVVEGKDAETPYRRAYYALDKDARAAQTYQQFLHQQQSINGWKDLTKFQTSRVKKPFYIISTYLQTELENAGATQKERDLVGKKLLNIIAASFFASDAPAYQVKVIVSAPEFKKILEGFITAQYLKTYLPDAKKQEIVNGIVNSIRGYHDGGLIDKLKTYLARVNTNKLNAEGVETMYLDTLSKKAASKIYKDNKFSPAYFASHPEAAAEFSKAVKAEQTKLHEKYKMADVSDF